MLTLLASRPGAWRDASLRLALQAGIPRLRVGKTRLRGLTVALDAPSVSRFEQELHLEAGLASPLRATLQASATVSRDRSMAAAPVAVVLSRLNLRYPRSDWRLAKDALLVVRSDEHDPGFTLSDFSWRDQRDAGNATLSAHLRTTGRSWEGAAVLEALDLGRLPLSSLSPSTSSSSSSSAGRSVQGRLDANVDWSGPRDTTSARAHVVLRDGALGPVEHVGADLVATLDGERHVSGRLRVDARELGHLRGDWRGLTLAGPGATAETGDAGENDGPLRRDTPFEAEVDLTDVALGRLPLPPATVTVGLAGTISAHLGVSGRLAAPRATLHLEGRDLVVTPKQLSAEDQRMAGLDRLALPLVSVDLAYRDPTVTLQSSVRDAQGGRLRLEASSRIGLQELRAAKPGLVARLRHRDVRGRMVMTSLDPAAVALFVPSVRRVDGKVTAALTLLGTVTHPSLEGSLSWKNGGVVTAHEGATPPHDSAADARDTASARTPPRGPRTGEAPP